MKRVLDFLDEGIVGAAALAFGLIVVLPLLPFIAIGWCFSRAASAMSAGTAETGTGSGLQPASAVAKPDAKPLDPQS